MINIKNIILENIEGLNTISADFDCGTVHKLWFKTKHPIRKSADAFVAASLVPAMKLNQTLNFTDEISLVLAENTNKIQNILSCWYPELNKIKIQAPVSSAFPLQQNNVACFVTGGVDSFYTLLQHQEEITKIIYVRGFDVGLYEREYLDMMSGMVKKIADDFGKELIEVETNIHVFADQYVDWLCHYHGAALASVSLLLSDTISKIYVPSNYSYKELKPLGTHPLLDGLWSTEKINIVYDDCESRTNKTKAIINNKTVLQNIRVCTDRTKGLYNCSRCEKCLRTMMSLYAFGVLDQCKTFDKLDAKLVSEIKLNEHIIIFAIENYDVLPDGDIKSALKIAIDRFKINKK